MHKLTIEDDQGKTVVVPLIRDQISVGRQEGNTIRLTEQNISRRHARMFQKQGVLFVEDLGSYNGVRVNGIRLSAPAPINDGDQIAIGDYKLSIKIDKNFALRAATPLGTAITGAAPLAAPSAIAPVALAPTGAPAAAPARDPVPVAAPAQPVEPPPAIGEAMDAAPTIPVRTLADQGLIQGVASVAPPSPGRLVVITTNLAGGEYQLDSASLVIGRTPENDIVLNHKSISRHHAKIIRDGGHYVVVDLESANGVRVNGAEHERTQLQSGDVLELGHVRLRFLAAGDNRPIIGSALLGGSSKRTMAMGLGAAVVVGGIALLLFSGDKPQEVKGDPKAALTQTTAATEPAAPPVPAAAPPAAAVPQVPAAPVAPAKPSAADSLAPLLAKAKADLQLENWAGASDSVSKAAAIAPDAPAVSEMRQAIDSQRHNAEIFATLKAAAAAKKFDDVLAVYASLPVGNAYQIKAAPLYQEARAKVITRHLELGAKASVRGKCDDAQQELAFVLAIDPQNETAKLIIQRCERPVAAAPAAPKAREAASVRPATKPVAKVPAPRPVAAATPTARPSRAASASSAPTAPRPLAAAAPAEEVAAPGADADALMAEAQDAWLKGQYAAAIDSSRRALKAKPGMTRAYQIIAVCSCSLRDADAATRAYDRLDDKLKTLVKTLCKKSGITIE